VRFHPETPFEGSCGDEVFTVLNQEAVPYAMASILAETMNAPLFKLPATTEPQKSHSVIKLLNGSREETILQTGVWLDKYQYGILNMPTSKCTCNKSRSELCYAWFFSSESCKLSSLFCCWYANR